MSTFQHGTCFTGVPGRLVNVLRPAQKSLCEAARGPASGSPNLMARDEVKGLGALIWVKDRKRLESRVKGPCPGLIRFNARSPV